MQIARALMNAADEALDTVFEKGEEEQLRTRVRNASAREQRNTLRKLKKRDALIGNTIAPGVPTDLYLSRVLADLPPQFMTMNPLR